MKFCAINFRSGALMLLAAAVFLGLAATAGAVDVILTKTQRLSGKVRSADGKSVTIEIPGQGVVAVPRAAIEKMSVEAPPAILRGVEAYEKGAYKEAQLTLAKVAYQFIGLDTDWAAKALVYYARVCLMNGDNAGAEKAFNTFIEVYDEDPLVVDAELGLAETQLAKNDVEKALAKFQELADEYEKVLRPPMAQFPYAAEAFLGVGKCLEAKQDFAGAANAYLKVIALYPAENSLPEALYRAAALYKKQKPEYAGMFLNDLITQYPASPFARKAADLQKELGVKK
ncbi:MAG: tetratricopeptide repeat protein [Kiritimatiellia bacterium]